MGPTKSRGTLGKPPAASKDTGAIKKVRKVVSTTAIFRNVTTKTPKPTRTGRSHITHAKLKYHKFGHRSPRKIYEHPLTTAFKDTTTSYRSDVIQIANDELAETKQRLLARLDLKSQPHDLQNDQATATARTAVLTAQIQYKLGGIGGSFSEESVTLTSHQGVKSQHNINDRMLNFKDTLEREQKRIDKMKKEYDVVLADIDALMSDIFVQTSGDLSVREKRRSDPLQKLLSDKIRALEGDIETLGAEEIGQLNTLTHNAGNKKKRILNFLLALEG